MKTYIQKGPPHPGEILAEFYFEPLGLTVTEAARKLDIPRPNLSMLVNKKMGISATMAIKLAKAFKSTPQYWLNLQNNYDLAIASQEQAAQIDKIPELV